MIFNMRMSFLLISVLCIESFIPLDDQELEPPENRPIEPKEESTNAIISLTEDFINCVESSLEREPGFRKVDLLTKLNNLFGINPKASNRKLQSDPTVKNLITGNKNVDTYSQIKTVERLAKGISGECATKIVTKINEAIKNLKMKDPELLNRSDRIIYNHVLNLNSSLRKMKDLAYSMKLDGLDQFRAILREFYRHFSSLISSSPGLEEVDEVTKELENTLKNKPTKPEKRKLFSFENPDNE